VLCQCLSYEEQVRDDPVAVVLGDLDLVSSLGLAGIRSVPVAAPRSPVRFSRFSKTGIDTCASNDEDALIDRLVRFAAGLENTPVLFYQSDSDLLLVSRRRADLQPSFSYVVPSAEMVEDLVDKGRFRALMEKSGILVPRSCVLPVDSERERTFELRLPVVVKATTRSGLTRLAYSGKAVQIDTMSELREVGTQAAHKGVELIAQEMVPGPETAIESYHAYIDEHGDIVADFTGRKVRTQPRTFGYSTAVCTTQSPDLMSAGRSLVATIGLRGVIKADYKRDPAGHLYLLEVNPRFSLWNHLGAAAGVNLPALVYADLTAGVRPQITSARAGLTWCQMGGDRRAAAEAGISMAQWLRWLVRTSARAEGRWSDPMPLLRGVALAKLRSLGGHGGAASPTAGAGSRVRSQ
jgi:predicted ATP-grasp superfamily ATP-dependent carboligase